MIARLCDTSIVKRVDTTPPTPVESYSDKISLKPTPVSKSTSPSEKIITNGQVKVRNGTVHNTSPLAKKRLVQSSRFVFNGNLKKLISFWYFV